ncbi:hypothetical protein TNCV_4132181 [Trichonephila clavipes]|nr:hypothetical protein TNCV_3575011 [Trichonephila clavipes]GFX71772.1 hypothetical protein TNCV_4132181 [Trichonephila clavipes]
MIQMYITTHGRKRLRSVLGGLIHKTIGGNNYLSHPALPQSFELASSSEQYRTFYEHRSGRHAPNLWISRNKWTSTRKVVSLKVTTER